MIDYQRYQRDEDGVLHPIESFRLPCTAPCEGCKQWLTDDEYRIALDKRRYLCFECRERVCGLCGELKASPGSECLPCSASDTLAYIPSFSLNASETRRLKWESGLRMGELVG